jgi:hypothetical protein
VAELAMLLEGYGLPAGRVIGKTPHFGLDRGHEIADWLAKNPHVTDFIILDDDTDMGGLLTRLVKTDYRNGLLDRHVRLALRMLGVKHAEVV